MLDTGVIMSGHGRALVVDEVGATNLALGDKTGLVRLSPHLAPALLLVTQSIVSQPSFLMQSATTFVKPNTVTPKVKPTPKVTSTEMKLELPSHIDPIARGDVAWRRIWKVVGE